MRATRFSWSMMISGCAFLLVGADEGGLRKGQDLPGPFQVWSVVHPTTERQGRYHSPVVEYANNPAVLIFAADAADVKPIETLLKKLDETIGKVSDISPGACAVFLNDAGYREALEKKTDDLPKAIEDREALEMKLKALGKDLKRVAVSMDSIKGPKEYTLDPKAEVTVLVYTRQKVTASFVFTKDKPMTDQDADVILAEFTKLLPIKKAPAKPSPKPKKEA